MLPQRDPFRLKIDHSVECVLNDSERRTFGGEEGLKNLKAMMAIYEAAWTGRTIALG